METNPPLKDDTQQQPVPMAWRPVLSEIVKSFVNLDYRLANGVQGVESISQDTADHIESYIVDYGEVLIELPDDTWQFSVVLWMGSYWDVIVDLWTEAEGRSDMVLSARVTEVDGEYRYDVQMVYVP